MGGLANAEDLGFKVQDSLSLSQLFEALDVDGSNSISWKEFVKVTVAQLRSSANVYALYLQWGCRSCS